MKALAEIESIIRQWATYISWCFEAPYSAPVCRPFWTWVAIGLAAMGGIVLLGCVWKFIDYKLKYRAALRAEEARQRVADEETMAAARWKGDDAMVASAVGPDVEDRIKTALARRKAGLDKPGL